MVKSAVQLCASIIMGKIQQVETESCSAHAHKWLSGEINKTETKCKNLKVFPNKNKHCESSVSMQMQALHSIVKYNFHFSFQYRWFILLKFL